MIFKMKLLHDRAKNIEYRIDNEDIEEIVTTLEEDFDAMLYDYHFGGKLKKAFLSLEYNHGYLQRLGGKLALRSTDPALRSEWKGLEKDILKIKYSDVMNPDDNMKKRMYELANDMLDFPKKKPERFYLFCAKVLNIFRYNPTKK